VKTFATRFFATPRVIPVSALVYIAYIFCFPVAIRYIAPPALQIDDAYFLLISYSWLNGLGLNNYWANPVGSGVFNWHGFLQPMLIAELAPCNTLRCLNTSLTAFGVFYLAIWYFVVNALAAARYLRWGLYVVGVSLVIRYSARPELLASLELIGLVLLFNTRSENTHYFVRAIGSGIGVGVAFLTSPFTGAFAGLGVAAATAFLRRNERSHLNFFLEGAISVISALCALTVIFVFIYPYPLSVWIDGIFLHAIRDMHREDTGGVIKDYFLTKGLPLVGILFITLAGITILAVKLMWRAENRVCLAVFCLVCAAFAYLLYFSAIRIPLTYYNFTALVPSILLVAIICLNNISAMGRYAKLALIGPAVAFAAVCVCSQVLWAAQWLSERSDHYRLSEGIAASVDQYLAENRRIAMDTPLIGAVDNVEKLKKIKVLIFGEKYKLNYDPPDVDVVFRAQNEFGLRVLSENMPGFRLVVDNFDHSAFAHLLTPEESYYAIYERVPH